MFPYNVNQTSCTFSEFTSTGTLLMLEWHGVIVGFEPATIAKEKHGLECSLILPTEPWMSGHLIENLNPNTRDDTIKAPPYSKKTSQLLSKSTTAHEQLNITKECENFQSLKKRENSLS
ncbi:hypothetical protein AVEN_271544-1 [Araneus ventricosus]|uniref:Uncharacterized protein n=1 Tax=Araneus ventricosus TaxID=182803 RepID=A0A4Y2Q994_ARAVE|nr:hypothetical protein AVEN_271544-1 [Araneus ventricosus]